MVSSIPAPQNLATDTWLQATWEEYVALADDPAYEQGRCYHDQGWMRIEMAALGPLHGRENSIVSTLITLFATLKNIRLVELTNTTFRKPGIRDAQPDIAFYIGPNFQLPPRNNQPVNVNEFGAPQLAVEIASTSLGDDLGRKRLLYERLGVDEYWVIDVVAGEVIAFEVMKGRSGQIQDSKVLPGLAIATIEEALKRSQSEDDSRINRWLLELFA
ncbi:MAG: Uma2 family endonuclease [Cyanothece sp. SIO1E1]|nr:Uma2 family endonuclease [Cyanothece sp. SIO1E1]